MPWRESGSVARERKRADGRTPLPLEEPDMDTLHLILADPFELFRFVIGIIAIGELVSIVIDLRRGYRRAYLLLEGVAGRYHLHELLRATIRLQVMNVVVRPRGWEELRILLVQSAAIAIGALTWWLGTAAP